MNNKFGGNEYGPIKITIETPDGFTETIEADAIIGALTKNTDDDLKARSFVFGYVTEASLIKAMRASSTILMGKWIEEGVSYEEIEKRFEDIKTEAIRQVLLWSRGVNTIEELEKKTRRELLDFLGDGIMGPGPM